MNVTVVHPRELGTPELDRWRAMQAATPSLQNPFLSPEFTLASGRARGGSRVAIMEDAGEIVGFFPHELRPLGIGKPIGAGISDCQGIVHAPGYRWEPRALLRGCGLVVWEFDHLLAGQEPFAPHHTGHECSPVMGLEGGYGSYLEDRRRRANKTVKGVIRQQRKMERELGDVRFVFDVRDPDALRTVMRWKSAQYDRTERQDQFGISWIVQVVEELFTTRAPECSGTLSVLSVDDRPVAAHFGIRSQRTLAYWFPAYDVEFATYSPGLQLCFQMAEAAAALGVESIDLGKGPAQYKDWLANREWTVAEGAVTRRSPVTAVRGLQRKQRDHLLRLARSHPKLNAHARRTVHRLRGLRK